MKKRLFSAVLASLIAVSAIPFASAAEADNETAAYVTETTAGTEPEKQAEEAVAATEEAVAATEETVAATEEAVAATEETVAATEETVAATEEATQAPVEKIFPRITRFDTSVKGGVGISFTAVEGAAKYRVFTFNGTRWTKAGDTASLRFVHNSLVNNTTYLYTVRALNAQGQFCSDYFDEGWAFTYLDMPVISSVENVFGGVKISWNKISGAAKYRVHVKDGSTWKELEAVSGTSYTDTNVVSGKAYSYTVRCVDENNINYTSSYDRQGKGITFYSAPVITKNETADKGRKLTWTKVNGVDKYRVYLKTTEGWKSIGETSGTTFTHTGIKNNTRCVYTVRGLNSSGKFITGFNGNGWECVYLDAPVITSVESSNDGNLIKWNKVTGAVNYRIYVKTDANSWDKLAETANNSFTHKGLVSGKTYTYTVRCISADGKTSTGFYDRQGKSVTFYSVPVITKNETADKGRKLTWTKVNGVDKYRVYLKTAEGWKGVGETSGTAFTHTGIKNNTRCVYTVRGLNSSGKFITGFNSKGSECVYLDAPVITAVESSNDGNLIKWNKVTGAVNYRVYVKTGANSWDKIAETANNSFTHKGLASGKTYTYTIRCISADGKTCTSFYDRQGKGVTFYSVPVITKNETADKGRKLTWTKVNGVDKYRVFLKTAEGWKGVGETSGTAFTHTGIKNNTRCVYTVRGLNSSGKFITGFNSKGSECVYLDAPVITAVESSNDGNLIKWNKVTGAVNYRVYVKTGANSWDKIAETANNSFTHKGLASGKTYTYTVRCISADSKTCTSFYDKNGKSNTFVVTPSITKMTNGATGTTIGWNKVAGASKYRVFIKNGTSWKTIGESAGNTFLHNNLKNKTSYTYTVRAVNSKGAFVSSFNKTGWTNIFFAPPAAPNVAKSGNNSVLSWTAEPLVGGYRVYRRQLGGNWIRIADVTTNSYTDSSAAANTVYAYTLRYLDGDGALVSHYIESNKYYYNGAPANGKINVGGKTLNFTNGQLRSGYVTVNGATYYYNSNGELQKNGVVGSKADGYRYADKDGKVNFSYTGVAKGGDGNLYYLKNGNLDFKYRNGVTVNGTQYNVLNGRAYQVKTEDDRMLFAAFGEIACVRTFKAGMTLDQKLKELFDYAKDAYREKVPRSPAYFGDDWYLVYARDILINGGGDCYSYGAAFAFMAKALGCKDVYACNSGGHGWTEINGLVYDVEWDRHNTAYAYYALSYDAPCDVAYKASLANPAPWQHVRIDYP